MIYVLIPTTAGRRARLQKCIDAIRGYNVTPHCIVAYENTDGGCVAAMHNALLGIKDHALVWVLNDDMVPEAGALDSLFKAWDDSENGHDGIAQPWENFHEGRLGVCPLGLAKTFKKYWFKGYVHNFGDQELTEVMKAAGKYLIVSEARVAHEHFLKDGKRYDETYDSTQRFFEQDKDLYHARKAAGFLPSNE